MAMMRPQQFHNVFKIMIGGRICQAPFFFGEAFLVEIDGMVGFDLEALPKAW
ncbi:MAG: hypothetical protein ABR973_04560 [Candidatus Acidiferrales bacterium]